MLHGVKWFSFNLSKDGEYKVHILRHKNDYVPTSLTGKKFNWPKVVPIKIRCFAWRATLDRLLVLLNLVYRGMKVQSTLCPLCNIEQETGLLMTCRVAKETREYILNCFGIPNTTFDNVNELINVASTWGNYPKKKERITAVFYGLLCYIWVARNNRLFKAINKSPTRIADNVISQAFYRFKFRTWKVNCRWIDWSISPFC